MATKSLLFHMPVNAVCIGANPSTTLWGPMSMEMAGPKGQSLRSEKRSSKGPDGGVIGEGMFLSLQLGDLWERCKLSPSGVRAKLRRHGYLTFYRLTKPLLVLILLILHWNFRRIRPPKPNFVGSGCPRDRRLWLFVGSNVTKSSGRQGSASESDQFGGAYSAPPYPVTGGEGVLTPSITGHVHVAHAQATEGSASRLCGHLISKRK